MRVAIVDYEAGNLTSVQRALHHIGTEAEITGDPERVRMADRVVFPGVGAAGASMAALRRRGLDQALRDLVAGGRPLLGICVGMQILFERSAEDGGVECLGILPGHVERIVPADPAVSVPHMGWNAVATAGDPLFAGIPDGFHFYFVHSYRCMPGVGVSTIGRSEHGGPVCAAVRRGALAAVQFHAEKSGPAGLRLLENFVRG